MGKMNAGKVLLGGLVAGVIINIGEWLTHGVFLKSAWQELMKAGLTGPEPSGSLMGLCFLSRFVIGLLIVWLYAAARPRLGGNVKSALLIAFVGSLLVWGPMSLDMGLFSPLPDKIAVAIFVGGMISGIVGSFVGAWLYTE